MAQTSRRAAKKESLERRVAERVISTAAPVATRVMHGAARFAVPAARRRAHRVGPDRTPFLILGAGRSGSTLLRHLLHDHPAVHCPGEVLNVRNPIRQALPGARERELLRPARLLHRRVFTVPDVAAAGFKLFYHHGMGSLPTAWAYLEALEGLRVIHLQRHDRLARYVSLQRAMRDGRWTRTENSGPADETPLALDMDHFAWWVQLWNDRRDAALQRLSGRPLLEVRYEDLAADRATELERIFAFLGVDPAPVEARLRRQRTRPLSEVVEDWDEVSRVAEPLRWQG